MPRTKQTSDKPHSVSVPIIGTVGKDGIKLRPDIEEEEERIQRESQAIAAFLNAGPPDFLMEAMLSAIDDAFRHVGMLPPVTEDGQLADYDEQNLRPLLKETKLVNWSDLWRGRERLATAISDILTSEETPPPLFDAVADFVVSTASGDTRKFWTVPMLEHLLEWYEESKEVSDADKETAN
jgi:hypothetical protein